MTRTTAATTPTGGFDDNDGFDSKDGRVWKNRVRPLLFIIIIILLLFVYYLLLLILLLLIIFILLFFAMKGKEGGRGRWLCATDAAS